MENEDRAVDRFRRQVAFVGLENGQTRDVRIVDEPNDWTGKQFTVVLRGSIRFGRFRRIQLSTFSDTFAQDAQGWVDLHFMIFAIACSINGLQFGNQLPKALWRF